MAGMRPRNHRSSRGQGRRRCGQQSREHRVPTERGRRRPVGHRHPAALHPGRELSDPVPILGVRHDLLPALCGAGLEPHLTSRAGRREGGRHRGERPVSRCGSALSALICGSIIIRSVCGPAGLVGGVADGVLGAVGASRSGLEPDSPPLHASEDKATRATAAPAFSRRVVITHPLPDSGPSCKRKRSALPVPHPVDVHVLRETALATEVLQPVVGSSAG